jgi:octaprenyl-diphosphate synthase
MPGAATIHDVYRDLGPALAEVEAEIDLVLASGEPAVADLCRHAGRFGGKRLRPALVLLIGDLLGGAGPRHVRLGAVVELIHLATLVHDDVIDEATLRRSQSTVNAKWSNYEAVLLGDIIFARAIHLLARLGDPASLLRLTRAVSTLCEGEILQNRHRHDAGLSEDDYYRIIGAKTAELYAAGAALAAHLAEVPAEVASDIGGFARELGLAFQIVDDALDLVGTEEAVGKSLGTDLRSGKMTLPLVLLRDGGGAEVRALVREVVEEREDPERLRTLRRELERAQAVPRALERAQSHVRRGLARVRPHVDDAGFEKLRVVTEFVVRRQA